MDILFSLRPFVGHLEPVDEALILLEGIGTLGKNRICRPSRSPDLLARKEIRRPAGRFFDAGEIEFLAGEGKILFLPAHLQDGTVILIDFPDELGTFADPLRIDIRTSATVAGRMARGMKPRRSLVPIPMLLRDYLSSRISERMW